MTVSKKQVVMIRNICRQEQEALQALAEDGKRIDQIRIDIVLRQYEQYLNLLKEYAATRRRELRRELKK